MVNIKKVFLFIFTFLFLANSSFALSINIFGEINEYSKVYSETISVTINCSESLNLTLPTGAKNVYFQDRPVNDKFVNIVDCNSKNLIVYNLNKLEILQHGIQRVERNFIGYESINYTYSLLIPLDFQVIANNSIPNNFEVILSNNKKLVNFPKNNVYIVYIENIKEDPALSLTHFKTEIQEPSALIMMLITFIIGIILTYTYFVYYKKNNIYDTVPSFVLSKEERDILEVIRKNPGINQKLIGIELDFSKARVSMFVNDLEQKKLVRRERFGRTFKVYLGKEVV